MKRKGAEFGRLLSLPEVAVRTSLSLATIRRWAAQRRFMTVKLGRRVLVPESEVEALIRRNVVEPTAPEELQI